MDRHTRRRFAAVVMAAGVATALAAPATASATPGNDPDLAAATVDAASPEMLSAMQRDLDLTAEEARERLAIEDVAMRSTTKLDNQLGSSFGGAWLNDDLKLVVAVTDGRYAAQVRALGAEPTVVAHSEAELDSAKATLDRTDTPAADEVPGWYVDVKNNGVVVQAAPGARAAALSFIRASGVDRSMVRVETTTETPRPLYDVRGGDAYYMGGGRCSVGFSVNGGYVTAGHCGTTGTSTSGYNQVSQGTFQGSSFPGNDYAWVAVNSNWTPRPWVNQYNGSNVTVAGAQEAAVGSSVCRSGSTTGWHCGSIQAKNQTVNYAQGSVYGLTRTSVCAEPGDSGGSYITGQQAQGVTSGGSGNCSSGGTTYFQPVLEILSAYGLTLVTGDGGGDPPPPPPSGCDSYDNTASGSLSGSGDYDIHPNGSYFYTGSGGHAGCLSGPSSSDFDLYLQKWSSWSGWYTVASSTSADSEETVNYSGTSGYYRWVVYSYSGSGGYDFGFNTP